MKITEDINEFLSSGKSDIIFKKIIFITNDRDSETNKTLGNLKDALQGTDVKLYVFQADSLRMEYKDDKLFLIDSEGKLEIEEETASELLVITRLGAQGEAECETAIEALQNRGFLVLNPLAASKRASNKYSTSVLLSEYELPQPRYTLITKPLVDNERAYDNICRQIYPKWGVDKDTDKASEFVIKILDGHGGTGVFLVNGSNMRSVLQAIFAINPEISLLMQKKEIADGGDIRVHVLTLRGKQKILGAMKRNKIDGDFRSNVSLGASASRIDLTDDQQKLALKAAKISGLPWCAVDIMPLKENDEEMENVILEFNASPGTDGISEVLGENFMSILLRELSDPDIFIIQERTAGFRERAVVKIDENDESIELLAKLDTGNGSKASTLSVDSLVTAEDGSTVTFTLNDKEYTMDIKYEADVLVGDGFQHRYIVTLESLKIGDRQLHNIDFALDEHRRKSTDILINRDVLRRMGYVVSSSATHMLTPKMKINRHKKDDLQK